MVIHALSASQILRNLARYLPITMFAAFVYWVLLTAGLFFLLKRWATEETARVAAVSAITVLVTVGLVLYIRFAGKRLSRCRLELADDMLTVSGQTSRGFVEKRFQLGRVEAIAIGEELNRAERILEKLNQLGVPKTNMIRMTKDLKAGRLLVRAEHGEETVFHFVDKVFDRERLLALLAELSRRGVNLETAF
jgi:hypothetical protein